MKYLDRRIEKVMESISEKDIALLITSDITRRYVYNFCSTAGFGYISSGRCELFLDFRYYEKAKNLQQEGKISKLVNIREIDKKRKDLIEPILSEEKISKLIYEDRHMTCSEFCILREEFNEIEFIPAGGLIDKQRAVKDQYELERMIKAQEITDKAFSYIVSYIKRGMRERDIALELEYYMRKNGADGLAFDTICVSGRKSSMPHGEPDETVVSDGFLTLDFGARFDGYCSDMTRTLCVGKPKIEMIKIYDTVLKAQEAAFSRITGNVNGRDVDAAAREVIYSAGYQGCFGHSTGHSLGLEIHESPNFSLSEKEKVPAGAVVSVEPGIYIEGKCGVRIEDVVFLTENGYKNLTNSTKEIIILK